MKKELKFKTCGSFNTSFLIIFMLYFSICKAQITIDPITEGATVIYTRNWNPTNFGICVTGGGPATLLDAGLSLYQYNTPCMTLYVNSTTYNIPTGFYYPGATPGFIYMPLPSGVFFPVGANVYLKYTCGGSTLTTNTVIVASSSFSVNFNAIACQSTVSIVPNYKDKIGTFSYVAGSTTSLLPFNGYKVEVNGVAASSGVGLTQFTPNSYTSISSGIYNLSSPAHDYISNYNSTPSASLTTVASLTILTTADQYINLGLGPVSICCANSFAEGSSRGYRFQDFSNTITERPISYSPVNTFTNSPSVGDVLKIQSTPSQYILTINSQIVYIANKAFTYTVSAGSIAPNPNYVGLTSIWNLTSTVGTYTLWSSMGNFNYVNTYTVFPVPTITSTLVTANICDTKTLNINLTSSVPSVFSWVATNNVNTTGESVTTQSTSIINDVLYNPTSIPQLIIYTVTPTGNGAIGIGACSGPTQTIQVTVNPTPTINITGTNVLCNGSSTSLLANGGSSYLWNTSSTSNPLIVTPSSTTNYTVTGTDANGCVNSKSISVTVNPLPNVNFAFNNDSLCVGGCVTFTNNSNVIGDVIVSYNWNFGDGGTSTVIDPTYCFPNSGTYTVSLSATTNNSCTATFMNTASPITISSFANANFDFSPTSPIDLGSVVNFLNSSTNSSSFYWEFGDGSNSNMIDPSHSYDNIGTYAVSLIAYNGKGCNDTLIKSLDIKNPIFIPEIFTPNGDGMNDFFVIKGIESFPNNTLKIFNRWGNIVFEKDSYKNDWDGKTLLNGKIGAERLPASTYFVIFNFGDNKTKEYSGIVQLAY